MNDNRITNFQELAQTENIRDALLIAEAGLYAINTDRVVGGSLKLENNVLKIKDLEVPLDEFKRIKVIGFGKASCNAAYAVEKVLGQKIDSGAVIDISTSQCEIIEGLVGTHPRPSKQNVVATKRIVDMARDLKEDDLVIVIVSGGGSALLCWPEEECDQGEALYGQFLKVGGTIDELNLVRKHLSGLKGGGLAKILYPARVLGLIFCDIPGNSIEEVASGPTFKDNTTKEDAQKLLDKYGFSGFNLTETPKEDKYFEKVSNISLVSNLDALEAMSVKASELGLKSEILSDKIYDLPEEALRNYKNLIESKKAVLGGGEVKLVVQGGGGSGGRCVQMALASLPMLEDGDVFLALASDGLDNSDSAGAVVDKNVLKKAEELGLNYEEYLKNCDSYNFFAKTGNLLFTGQTGANVSDLMLWIRR